MGALGLYFEAILDALVGLEITSDEVYEKYIPELHHDVSVHWIRLNQEETCSFLDETFSSLNDVAYLSRLGDVGSHLLGL